MLPTFDSFLNESSLAFQLADNIVQDVAGNFGDKYSKLIPAHKSNTTRYLSAGDAVWSQSYKGYTIVYYFRQQTATLELNVIRYVDMAEIENRKAWRITALADTDSIAYEMLQHIRKIIR